jgi:GTP-binding protein Era
LNHLLRQKVSITSRKPQTTRHRILGINSDAEHQCIYVDTPGLHSNQKKALNKVMNNTVVSVINDVDLILFLIEKTNFNEGDHRVLELLSKTHTPVLLLINKIDLVKDKESLLPHINALSKQQDFNEIVPVSALGGHNLRKIEELVKSYLPRREFLFPEDQVTDRSSRFLAAELIREKVIRQLGDELPYEVTVEIENFQQQESILHIHGLILVDKPGQKKILIGKDGERLKRIGSSAREDMETAFETKVMLNLWVKVKSGWADDERALQSLGYMD